MIKWNRLRLIRISDKLDPASEAELEEEAACSGEGRYGAFLVPGHRGYRPLPYFPTAPPSLAPPLALPAPLVQELTETKTVLQAHITGFKQVLHLKQELGDLSLEIQSLQEMLEKRQNLPKKALKETKDRSTGTKLAFPVLTRACTRQAVDTPRPDSTNINQGEDSDQDQETEEEQN